MEKENKKIVNIFSFASFFNDLGAEMAYPVLPLFLRDVLGANMTVIGIVDGLAESMVAFAQALAGYLADKIKKRKIFIWIGYLIAGISRLGYGFSYDWRTLAGFRVLNNFGKIREAPRDAIVSDVSFDHNRGRNFGILRMMDNLGAFFGVILCILFFGYLGYRRIFLLASVPSLISAILIILCIKELENLYSCDRNNFKLSYLSKNYKKFLIASIIFALGSFSYSFILVFVKESGITTNFIPLYYLIFILFASLFSIPFGRLVDKLGRKNVLNISFLLWGMVCLSFIFLRNKIFYFIPFILYGMHKGALEPAERTFISELSPFDYKTSGLGIYKMIIGLCNFPAGLIAGFLWDKFNKFTPFYFSLITTFITFVLLLFVKEDGKK